MLADELSSRGIACELVGFPGNEVGTLGRHIYELHHEPKRFHVERMNPVSLQSRRRHRRRWRSYYHADRNADFFDLEWMFGLDPTRRRPGTATLRGNFSLINETSGQAELVPTQTTSSGFDIVIGNPPYVRQEEIKDLKPKLKDDYFCYTGVADLFVYFYERSFDLLRVPINA